VDIRNIAVFFEDYDSFISIEARLQNVSSHSIAVISFESEAMWKTSLSVDGCPATVESTLPIPIKDIVVIITEAGLHKVKVGGV